MREVKRIISNRGVQISILVIVALLSIFVFAKITSSPDFNADAMQSLDEKKVQVTGLAATAAATSTALSLIPGDVAMPVAEQIAELSSYFVIILAAIILEKVLLSVVGHVTFVYIIPAACLLFILFICTRKDFLLKMGIKLAIFGIVIFLAIPASIYISDLVENAHQQQLEQALQNAEENKAFIEDKKEDLNKEDENWMEKIGNYVSNLADKVENGISDMIQKAEDTLSSLLDSVAILIITSCVIPVIVILLFVWIIKILFGFEINIPRKYNSVLPNVEISKIQ